MAGEPRSPSRRLLIQIVGFILGVALLVWCIVTAVRGGDAGWTRLRDADPTLIAALLGTSVLSQVASVLVFWFTIRKAHPLKLVDLAPLNLVVSLLNYAPVRLGLVVRVAYHLRVDRLSVILIGAWFAAMGLGLVTVVLAAVTATAIHPTFDWLWLGLLATCMVVGGLALRAAATIPILQRHGRGADRVLSEPTSLWGGLIFRMVDLGAYALRMGVASSILGLSFTVDQIMLLAIASMVIGMNPLSRFGFREVAVALVASQLAQSDTTSVEGIFAQLALVESASEAIVVAPLGLLAAPWFVRRWRRSSKPAPAAPATESGDASADRA